MRRLGTLILGGLGGLIALLGLLWLGYGVYIQHVVARSPGTISIVRTDHGPERLGVYDNGDQVVADREPATTTPVPLAAGQKILPVIPTPTLAPIVRIAPTPTAVASAPILPPTHLRIPKIGVDVPVVLADGTDLPRFKGVGWYLGSGYPGFRGNMVLFGHLNGVYETFGRLHELAPGDEILVDTVGGRRFQYRVSNLKIVPESAVEVLAPSRDYEITLLTCTGTFFPLTRDYSDRLVVIGQLMR